MENNIFSPRRFGKYFQLQLSTNWKTLTIIIFCILGGIILYCTCLPYLSDIYALPPNHKPRIISGHEVDRFWNAEIHFFYFIFYVLTIISASLMFSSMKTKSQRISTLTLPASTLEKYLTYFIIYVIAIYVVLFVCMAIGDYARVLSTKLYPHNDEFIKPIPFKYIFSLGYYYDNPSYHMDHENYFVGYWFAIYFGSLIVTQGYMALISAIWPKNSFIKGTGTAMIFTFLMIICVISSFKLFGYMVYQDYFPKFSSLSTVVWSITIILSIVLFAVSYFRFKENEVIDRW